jgi:hypothetical protein
VTQASPLQVQALGSYERLAPRAECGLETRLELVWRQAGDDDPLAATRGTESDLELRTWYVENVGEESQERGGGRAVDRWRGDTNLNGAVRPPFDH